MFYLKLLKRNIKYFFFDHKTARFGLTNGAVLICAVVSAFIFAVGFKSFINIDPEVVATFNDPSGIISRIGTGGSTGIAQSFVILVQIFDKSFAEKDVLFWVSNSFIFVNIPLIILSFVFKLGWRFSIFTTINVALVWVFTNYLPSSFFNPISKFVADQPLTRALFAGVLTGVSSGIAYAGGHSAGGIDIIGALLARKKSTNVGKYLVIANGAILVLYTALSIVLNSSRGYENSSEIYTVPLVSVCFSAIYLFTTSLVIDVINIKNKKVLLHVITDNEALANFIVANVPHGCTITKGKGGYSGKEKTIIYLVVSSSESSKLAKNIRFVDQTAFISSINLRQVYGNFFISQKL